MIRILLLGLAIAACDARAAPGEAHVVEPLPPPAQAVAQPEAAPTVKSSSKEPDGDEPSNAPRAGSRKEMIDLVVTPDILALRSEQALARFANIRPLVREAETIDGFLLVNRADDLELNLNYLPDGNGGFVCISATLEFFVTTPDESAEVRSEVDRQLRAKLGKPKFYPAAPATPYWKLVRRVEASLSEYQNVFTHRRTVAIHISTPDGP